MQRLAIFQLLFQVVTGTVMLHAQVKTVTTDTDWAKQQAILKNTKEAGFIIRIGDIDNLGFGWPEAFDPFCGRMAEAHPFPWTVNSSDLPGFDRILLPSKYSPSANHPCLGDGYSESYDAVKTRPVPWTIPTDVLKGSSIQNAYLQIFIDDFQAPSVCSKFQMQINGMRFVEGEKMLNAIDQTGPVGKLISIPLTEDRYPDLLNKNTMTIFIDEYTGAGDGFAVDFIRLVVNRNLEYACKGSINGKVFDKDTDAPIAGAKVYTSENTFVETNNEGEFRFVNLPAGFAVLEASATGYDDGAGTADIGQGDENPETYIFLVKGKTATFNNKNVRAGESITLANILFDQGKAELKNESKQELDVVVSFLKANASAEIELSGYTSSEGDRDYNRSLSYKRVKSCKDYIVENGISEARIIAVGYGPDHPVAPNDTEANKAKNRRVEMRIMKL